MSREYIIVVNPGSSSYKFALYHHKKEVCRVNFQKRAEGYSVIWNTEDHEEERPCSKQEFLRCHKGFLSQIIERKLLPSLAQLRGIGVRVVHGGEFFRQSAEITPKVLASIRKNIELAPVHNAIAHRHILAWQKLLPRARFIAVFDTAFHRTIPEYIAAPALPKRFRDQFHIHKFGFHGISCQSILRQLSKIPERVIICHLGSGASITAIRNGESFNTSMGFTPMTGIPMSTRSGDIGGDILLFLQKKLGITPHALEEILNRESGLLGLSGISHDMRVLMAKRAEGNPHATLAIQSFVHHVVEYIGSFITTMNGIDAIIFTGGMGEDSWEIRKEICDALSYHGIKIHNQYNKQHGPIISTKTSKATLLTLPTQEMELIAEEAYEYFSPRS